MIKPIHNSNISITVFERKKEATRKTYCPDVPGTAYQYKTYLLVFKLNTTEKQKHVFLLISMCNCHEISDKVILNGKQFLNSAQRRDVGE